MFLLSKTNITKANFEEASRSINKFTNQYEKYYGLINMVYNVHLLDHIPDCVCGPLWASSNFNFEDNNGHLAALVQGTNSVEKQILSKINYDAIITKFSDKSVPLQEYVKHLNNTYVKNSEKIGEVTLFGKSKIHLCNEEERRVTRCISIQIYKKMFYNGDVFFSQRSKSARTNDSIIKLKDGTFAEILFIFRNEMSSVRVLTKKLTLCDQYTISNLKLIAFTNDLAVHEVEKYWI
ncbi:hypothetical protein HA402_009734 [Bradysia odoriphaga]|nr:hypothetical protein HA402_009734 [Bradysia odoriphaga]